MKQNLFPFEAHPKGKAWEDVVKRGIYCRHTDKDHEDGSGERTGKNGMTISKKLGRTVKSLGYIITDVFGGFLTRTWESPVAFMGGYLPTVEYNTHPYIAVGDKDLFGKVITPKVKEKIGEFKKNWPGVKAGLNKNALDDFLEYANQGLMTMFEKTSDTFFIQGHSPVLEATMESIGYDVDYQPGVCEGVVFAQYKDGSYAAVAKIVLK